VRLETLGAPCLISRIICCREDYLSSRSREWREEISNPQDRVALVTGSSQGVGRRIAQRLVADGSLVIVHGRDEECVAYTVLQC
jgi:3-oxoacyl-ACP reductase-like protein